MKTPDLTQELNLGGRSIPLWVPAAGAVIAIALLVISRLKPGGSSAAKSESGQSAAVKSESGQSAPPQPPAVNGPPPGQEFASAISALQGNVAQIEGNVAEQIASAQEKFGGRVGGVESAVQVLAGQLEGFQSGMSGFSSQIEAQSQSFARQLAGQSERLQGQIGAQGQLLGGQIAQTEAGLRERINAQNKMLEGGLAGVRGEFASQIEQQAAALSAGISGVASAQTAFAQDVNARMAKIEQSLVPLQRDVESQKSGLSVNQKFQISQAIYFLMDRMLNPSARKSGATTWSGRISAATGGIEAKPDTEGGYYQRVL